MKGTIWLMLLLVSNSHACECIFKELAESFSAADTVFVGRAAASANFCELTNQKCWGGPGVSLLIRKEVFKDESPGESVYLGSSEVWILNGGSNCDPYFAEGKDYVIFGYAVYEDMLSTSTCAGTFEYESSPNIVAAVRELADAHFKTQQLLKADPLAPLPLPDNAN